MMMYCTLVFLGVLIGFGVSSIFYLRKVMLLEYNCSHLFRWVQELSELYERLVDENNGENPPPPPLPPPPDQSKSI